MAEVLSRSHDDQSYYSGSSLKRSAPSRTSLLVGSPPHSSALRPALSEPSFEHLERGFSRSLPSSTSLSTRQSCSDFSSFSSTPASTLSFESQFHGDDQGLAFPAYDEVQFFHEDEALPPSPRSEQEEIDSQTETRSQSDASQEPASTTDSTRSDSPLPTPTVADDTAIKHEPSRHVDYLSHDWREEDIWSSWRHIVSQRKVYGQRSRLENASWRTWAKSKYQLATVSPETLNWLKESDVTWLYGPLQPAISHPVTHSAADSPCALSTSNSFVAKKPILKKRSMSEVMLQRSLSASSLVKQAAASVQAQQTSPPIRRSDLGRASSVYASPATLSVPVSRDHLDFLDLDYFSPRPSSGEETPFEGPKRHIRFDDKVEQCIAVDCKDGDDDDSDDGERHIHNNGSDSDSSDDGIVMMKRPKSKRTVRRNVSRNNSTNSKTIEKLPDTTLKHNDELLQVPEQPPTPFGRSWSSSKLSPSASQETLRPVSASRNYILSPDDDEDDDFDAEAFRNSAFAGRRDSVAVRRAQTTDMAEASSADNEQGLKRTGSGMFLPYEEDEDDLVAAGLFGRVSDTINTAKDIATVLFNVGWRK